MSKRAVSPLIAAILLIALTVSIGAMIIGWGRQYVQKQTSCLGVSVQITNLGGDNKNAKITIKNTGTHNILAGRLEVVFVLTNGEEVVYDSSKLTYLKLDGTTISDPAHYSISPGGSIIIQAPWPSGETEDIYIKHSVCGEISNTYLVG